MFVKIYFYKLAFTLKHYKLMCQYLARNLKANPNILDLFNLRVYGNGHRHATQFVTGPIRFDQNGMDFATEISLCKTPIVDEKMLILQ